MDGTDICWSCKIAQAAGFVRESWPRVSRWRVGSGKSRKKSASPKPGSQRNSTSNSNKHQPEGSRNLVQEQRVVLPGPTLKSPVTVSYPKITTGPSLVKRKLGSNHWDAVHERIQGQKRDAGQCPADYQSCAASLNGGCCPTDRICDTSSCLPGTSTAAVASACGLSNYFACGIADGGGCCPTDYVCGLAGCTLSAGVTNTETCSPGYYLCPASLNYGCCQNGLGCAYSSCYNTVPTTFTVTEITTSTDSNSNLYTITTTITSETVEGAPTTALVVPKQSAVGAAPSTYESAIPKTSATSTAAVSSSGLTKAELGGIIGGACFLLVAILTAAFCIMRRLNKTIKVSEAVNSRTASSEPQSRSRRSRPAMQQRDIDEMSVDPLMMTPSEANRSVRRSSKQSSILHTTTHELASPTSPAGPVVFQYPFSNTMSPQYIQDYNPVAASESQYSNSSGGHRNPSLDSSPPLHHNPNAGYFDFAPQGNNPRHSQVSSIPGRRPSQHGRHWSDASDVSQDTDPAELDGEGSQRSSFQNGVYKMVRKFSRKKNEPVVLQGGPARAPDWMSNLGGALGHIAEAGESRIAVDSNGISGAAQTQTPFLVEGNAGQFVPGGLEYDQKFAGRGIDLLGGRMAGNAS